VTVIGIDPGAKQSSLVVWDSVAKVITYKGILDNDHVPFCVRSAPSKSIVAIEQLRGYGLRVGNDTFDSIWWSGVFAEAAKSAGMPFYMLPRADICNHLTDNPKCGDKGIRDALIDRYGEQGSRKEPGRLYGIKSHMWAALAAAVVAGETEGTL